MKAEIDLQKILKKGKLESELDLERASVLNRKLRLLVKEHPELSESRKKLCSLIMEYEKIHWSSSSDIFEQKIKESDVAEFIAEQERLFFEKRKECIKESLSKLNMTQQDLGTILGHKKSYISELINGICPFSIRDIIIINRLFHIELKILIPTIISQEEKCRLKESISKLKNPDVKLRLEKKDLEFA